MRIIAGEWRRRQLKAPPGDATRPTADRTRETLFSMLASRLGSFEGLHVADLFAGSGALGLEALSRGAAQVTFVEQDRRAAAAIEALASEWREAAASVVCADALAWLAHAAHGTRFDIVLLDPPYDAGLLAAAARALADGGLLAPDGRIYIEHRARDALPTLPEGWRQIREGRAGEVGYHLFAS